MKSLILGTSGISSHLQTPSFCSIFYLSCKLFGVSAGSCFKSMHQCKDLGFWGHKIRNTKSFVKFALELHKNLNLLLVIFSLPPQVSFKFQSSSSSLFSFKCQTIHHFALSPFPVNLKVLLVCSNVSLGQCTLITQNNVVLVTLPIFGCELSRTVQELLLSPSAPCYHMHDKKAGSNIC